MNAIEIKNLTKSYGEFKLDDLSLCLPQGCIMGLVGENGAGKSTTIRLILDMIKRDSGTISVLGRDNRDNFRLTKEDIGVVLDSVGFPECLTARQLNRIMESSYKNWDETQFFAYLKKLNVPESKAFREFSRGMKMKIGIATAMSHGARLLILDEATSGLDPVARDEVLDMFSEFTRDEKNSVLISSHIVSDLEKICDYIAFIHRGKLMLCEEKDVLLEEYGIVNCRPEELARIPEGAVIGRRESAYGVRAIVRRCAALGMQISPVTLEELFVFMVKEA